jgi:hypothetical protein
VLSQREPGCPFLDWRERGILAFDGNADGNVSGRVAGFSGVPSNSRTYCDGSTRSTGSAALR